MGWFGTYEQAIWPGSGYTQRVWGRRGLMQSSKRAAYVLREAARVCTIDTSA
jgi:hypothetical protein